MKSLSIYLLAIITIITSCSSCKKNTDPAPDNPYGLPNATQTGANVFACRINGNNFIAHYDLYGTKAVFLNDTLWVSGTEKPFGNYFHNINFLIYSPTQLNFDYKIQDNNCNVFYRTDSTCLGISSTVFYSHPKNATIRITRLDKSPYNIVSGIFSGIFPIDNCDTLKVTDGRFDFQY